MLTILLLFNGVVATSPVNFTLNIGFDSSKFSNLGWNQDFEQQLMIGNRNLGYGDPDNIGYMAPDDDYFIEQVIQQPLFAYTDFPGGAPNNISVDDGFSDLGSNIEQISVDAEGYITISMDFNQQIDQDIIQDVFYEIDLVQTFIQALEINQDIVVNEVRTETRTRLVGQ